MSRMRVLLLGAALLSAETLLRVQALADERDVDIVTDSDAVKDRCPGDRVVVVGGGFERFDFGDSLICDPYDVECAPGYDWDGRYYEANLPEPVGCRQALVRLKAVNERSLPLSPRLWLSADNRTVKGRVWSRPPNHSPGK